MATLAMQPITPAGVGLAYATATVGGDRFTPGADVLLHLVNTGGSPVTITIPTAVPVVGSHVADVVVTIAAGASTLAGPFPAPFFANPADGLASIAYGDAAHTQVAATGFGRGRYDRGTIVTQGGPETQDLPSGSLVVADSGDMFLSPSARPPTIGQSVTAGTATPVDLPSGSVYFQVVGGEAVAAFFVGGESALDLEVTAAPPTDLALNQAVVVIGADGAPSDLYVGGIS